MQRPGAEKYVELHARSAFSFLRGASFPEQLAERAAELEMPAMAVCDRDGLYGAPRFHGKAREHGVRPIVGAELTLDDGSVLPVLVQSRTGYQNLCQLITRAKLRGTKAEAPVQWSELAEFAEGLVALTGDEEGPLAHSLARDDLAAAHTQLAQLQRAFGEGNVYVEVQRHLRRGEERGIRQLVDLARSERLPLLATNGVLHAQPEQRAVLDVFTCARHHTHLDAAGRLLSANGERYLKSAAKMAWLFQDLPEALENTVALAERLEFGLEKLGYEFPRFPVPAGETQPGFLRARVWEGLHRFKKLDARVTRQLEKELALIEKLGFCGYFLCIWDLVEFAKTQHIMVQGRGSAANSAVCFALGITACDPIAYSLLFERFLAEGRNVWPDIDLDLPSGDRREKVIQEVYRRYGKHGAAMTANVISYRGRSAMREIGKALHFPPDVMGRFSALYGSGDFPHTLELRAQLRQSGLPLEHPRAEAALALYGMLHGLPRHLGQHSGGMIICQDQLSSFIPLENASMPGRVVAQWDKDDCADLGIIKVDLLGLGMMAALQETIELSARRGRPMALYEVPADDPETYAMICAAETIGLFQIESRAQMATLPRLRPNCFYDLVIEVAIVRPGPIQGGLMHPYLARRNGQDPVHYFHPEVEDLLKPTLERTLGVPLFQEQMLKMSMDLAGFTGGEAEELRRALSFHRSHERMEKVIVKLRRRMEERGHREEVTEQLLKSVQSFAVYGFPESHAISFALLAYASAWYKMHRAPEFYTALLNNQPMGFYSASTLVMDAQRRGVRIRPVNVRESDWLCTLGADDSLRLGLCYVRGLRAADGARLVAERERQPFASLADFQLRTALPKTAQRALARIGALNGLAEHRRAAQWQVEVQREADDLFAFAERQAALPLAPMSPPERTQADYHGTGLTTGPHPMAGARDWLYEQGIWRAADLVAAPNGTAVRIAGMVICRQRPGTAKGFVFISLEDETGVSNAVVTPQLFEKERLLISEEPFLMVEGVLQKVSGVIHVKARRIRYLPHPAQNIQTPTSRDFH